MREESADSRRSGTAFPPAGAFSFPGLLRAEKRPSPSRQQKGRGKPPSLKNAQQKHPLPGRPYRPEKGFPQRRGIQTFCGEVNTGISPGTARGQKAHSAPCLRAGIPFSAAYSHPSQAKIPLPERKTEKIASCPFFSVDSSGRITYKSFHATRE